VEMYGVMVTDQFSRPGRATGLVCVSVSVSEQ